MKKVFLFLCVFFMINALRSQVVIGDAIPDGSAELEVISVMQGILPPRMTEAQRDAIVTSSSSAGLIIYNTNTNRLNVFDGVLWHAITSKDDIVVCSEELVYNDIVSCIQFNFTPDQTLGYSQSRDVLYSIIDLNPSNLELTAIYSNYSILMDYSTDPDPSVHAFNLGINAEHLFPQSMGAGDEPARSDMFNIFPSRADVNSSRSNFPFDDIVDTDSEFWYIQNQQITTIPTSNIDLYSEKDNDATHPLLPISQQYSFEPPEHRKGDIARAIFYFYVIYNANNLNNYPSYANTNFFETMKSTLLQWHIDDPVDQAEIERNNAIKIYQGNDNPFVIDMSLAIRLFN